MGGGFKKKMGALGYTIYNENDAGGCYILSTGVGGKRIDIIRNSDNGDYYVYPKLTEKACKYGMGCSTELSLAEIKLIYRRMKHFRFWWVLGSPLRKLKMRFHFLRSKR